MMTCVDRFADLKTFRSRKGSKLSGSLCENTGSLDLENFDSEFSSALKFVFSRPYSLTVTNDIVMVPTKL